SGELVLEPLHRGHLLAARVAPRRPEVEQHDLALVVREPVLLAVDVAKRKRRRGAARPGLHGAAGRPRRAGCGERRDKNEYPHEYPRAHAASFSPASTAKSLA